MQNTNSEDLMPPALPAGATFYHKHGIYNGNLHDAAIVKYNGKTFVLTVYTHTKTTFVIQNSTNLIQDATRAVIKYEDS